MIRHLDPSALADYQDETIRLPGVGAGEARARLRELARFGLLFRPVLGFQAVPRNNLYIRQHLLFSALHHVAGEARESAAAREEALAAFREGLTDGPFYVEGYSYFRYVADAFRFHRRLTGEALIPDLLAAVEGGFRRLAAPDGRVPVTDTRAADTAPPDGPDGFTFLPGFTVFRRQPDLFLLIAHNPGITGHRRNLHVNFDFGHFCLYGGGAWWVAHEWYEGYARKRSGSGGEPWARNVIVGGFNREPHWRYLGAPKLRVHEAAAGGIRLGIDKAERAFTFRDDGFEVTDRGGDYSAFSLGHRTAVGPYARGPAAALEPLRYDKFNRDLADPAAARCRLHGKERSVRFYYPG